MYIKKNCLLTIFSFGVLISTAQKNDKISIEINYGLIGKFFGYDEAGVPQPGIAFYKKNFIGTIGGIEAKYHFGKKSYFGIGYARSINSRTIEYYGRFSGTYVGIEDFKIRHTNNFYQFYYERQVNKKGPELKCHLGLFYLRMSQQEVDINNYAISFEERNFKNSKLEEGGAFFGIECSKYIDTKFELGIKSRIYYLISTNSLEAITLTPTLRYHF